jgi:hypothetical protein
VDTHTRSERTALQRAASPLDSARCRLRGF